MGGTLNDNGGYLALHMFYGLADRQWDNQLGTTPSGVGDRVQSVTTCCFSFSFFSYLSVLPSINTHCGII